MAVRYGFFDSKNGDRRYPASWFNEYFKGMIGEGVFPNPSSNLQVMADNTNVLVLKPGKYWHSDGYWLTNDADIPYTVPDADVLNPRWDALVIQLFADEDRRKLEITYKTGTPGANPVHPPADPSATTEFPLADIYVDRNAAAIGQENVTDRRTKAAVLLDHVDTETLYIQYQTALDNFLFEQTNRWETWFQDKQEQGAGVSMRELTKVYITEEEDETEIPVEMPEYVPDSDVLHLYVNGLKVNRTQYIISGDGAMVTLAQPLPVVGTEVEIVILKMSTE